MFSKELEITISEAYQEARGQRHDTHELRES